MLFTRIRYTSGGLLNRLLIVFFILSYGSAHAQIEYQPGYFITNNDVRVSCLIKNMDWYNTPESFVYKTDKNAAVQKGLINEVKEFGVYNESKYIRAYVKIDTSGTSLQNPSWNRAPEFQEDTVFLKMLTDEKISLLVYQKNGNPRYFFRENDSLIQPLIYKNYMVDDGKMATNMTYQIQIQQLLNNAGGFATNVQRLQYNRKDLVSVFEKINGKSGDAVTTNKPRSRFLNLTVHPGLQLAALQIVNYSSGQSVNFNTKLGVTLGLEAAFIMPFNKNKWSIIAEPLYTSYKSSVNRGEEAEYKIIDILVGIRHSFFLSKRSSLFLNGAFSYAIPVSAHATIQYTDLNFIATESAVFGAGWKYNKFSAALRYGLPTNPTRNYVLWNTSYKAGALVLGYSFF